MAGVKSAALLVPGDRFLRVTRNDEKVVTAAVVNALSHRVSVQTTEGEWFAYFPDARLVLA